MYLADPTTVRAGGPSTAVHVSGLPPSGDPAGDTEPAAVGIDLGSGSVKVWASGRALLRVPAVADSLTSPSRLVIRGRITDHAGLEGLLVRLVGRYHRPLPAGAVIVACRPVQAGPDWEDDVRRLLTAVFAPSRVLFVDTVRAAAIGAGAAPGPLVVADVGSDLTEVAVLANGGVVGARRADLGTGDLIEPGASMPVVHAVADLFSELRRDPRCRRPAATALGRGLVLVGGGAARPELAARIAGLLGLAVRPAAEPAVTAVRGAGLAALAALRRSAMRVA
jgi:rod shape-determining protein MreB